MPTDPKAVASKRIRKPGDRPPRYLIYGRNKQGKTTFSATAPGKVLILDPEGGAEHLSDRVDLWPITAWPDMDEVYRFLRTPDHGYDWVVADGLTRLANMSLRFVMKQQEDRDLDRIPGMVQKQDYGKSGELIKGMLFNFHALPIGVIYTSQDRMDTGGFADGEDDDAQEAEARYVPDLPKGVRAAVNGIVDVIGRIYSVHVEGTNSAGKAVKGRQRRLWIAPSDQYDTGYRHQEGAPKPPDFIKSPTVQKLIDATNKKGS